MKNMVAFCIAHSNPNIFGYVQVLSMNSNVMEWANSTKNWACEQNNTLKHRQVHNDGLQIFHCPFVFRSLSQLWICLNTFGRFRWNNPVAWAHVYSRVWLYFCDLIYWWLCCWQLMEVQILQRMVLSVMLFTEAISNKQTLHKWFIDSEVYIYANNL
jgi:hypothetical protein